MSKKSFKKYISWRTILFSLIFGIILGASIVWFCLSKLTNRPSILFVEGAKSGNIVKYGRSWKFTLVHPNKKLVFFTDRPSHMFGEADLDTFFTNWNSFTFTKNPPNAAISFDTVLNNKHNPSVILATLSQPTYETAKDTVTFVLTPLKEVPDSMNSFKSRLVTLSEQSFIEPSLFIDGATDNRIAWYENQGINQGFSNTTPTP